MVSVSHQGKFWLGWLAVLACLPLAVLPLADAWRGLRLASDPTFSTSPPGDYRSLRRAGSQALQAGRLPAAKALFQRALALSPMDAESWRLLATAERETGHPAAQTAALRLAGTLTWRDPPTQRRLMLDAFGDDALPAGITHADALLRQMADDRLGMAVLMTATNDPDGQAALADHLAASPAWRKPFFAELLIGGDEDAQGLVGLLRRMRGTPAPPTAEENDVAVAKLIQAGYGTLALDYWRRASGRAPGHDFTNDDPDFAESLPALQAAAPASPFGWAIAGGAAIQIGGGRDPAGRPALTFDGPPDGVDRIISRPVLLAPGTYQLSFAGAADGRPTARFRPRFTCAVGGRSLPFDTLHPHDADGYLLSRVAVSVPPDCTVVSLAFGLAPGGDGQTHGFALRQVRWSRNGG